MRDAIARVLLWALSRVLPAEDTAVPPPITPPEPGPPRAVASAVRSPSHGRGWATPTPAHVVARQRPLRGEDCRTVRPYVLAEETLHLRAMSAGHNPYAHAGTYG